MPGSLTIPLYNPPFWTLRITRKIPAVTYQSL